MRWTMKTERGVVQLAGGDLKVEQIATKLKISPQAVIKIGQRVGIYFSWIESKRDGRRKAK
jgi:hypothetical protein